MGEKREKPTDHVIDRDDFDWEVEAAKDAARIEAMTEEEAKKLYMEIEGITEEEYNRRSAELEGRIFDSIYKSNPNKGNA